MRCGQSPLLVCRSKCMNLCDLFRCNFANLSHQDIFGERAFLLVTLKIILLVESSVGFKFIWSNI